MLSDPNPGRSVPMGGRTFPAGAAGTQLPSGLVLSGDDAPAFERAGYTVARMVVQCSAKIVAGAQTVDHDAQYVVAIDRNGQDIGRIVGLTFLRDARPATGIFNGATQRAVVGYLTGRDIYDAHAALSRHVPGFECFAVMRLA